jgi:hypothetical protein
LFDEFEHQREIGVKLSAKLLKTIAHAVLAQSIYVFLGLGANVPGEEESIMSKITDLWVQTFIDRCDISQRKQTGKLMASPEKEDFMERQVA